jgi:hypothetical protein
MFVRFDCVEPFEIPHWLRNDSFLLKKKGVNVAAATPPQHSHHPNTIDACHSEWSEAE